MEMIGNFLIVVLFCGSILLERSSVGAFYLPGVAPHSYEEAENVDLKVNKLR